MSANSSLLKQNLNILLIHHSLLFFQSFNAVAPASLLLDPQRP